MLEFELLLLLGDSVLDGGGGGGRVVVVATPVHLARRRRTARFRSLNLSYDRIAKLVNLLFGKVVCYSVASPETRCRPGNGQSRVVEESPRWCCRPFPPVPAHNCKRELADVGEIVVVGETVVVG